MKKKAGRPEIKINWEKVDGYLKSQCLGTGIASILGISAETLYRKCQEDNKMGFDEYSAQKKGEGKELLRAKQFQLAMNDNVPMNIWLGKQYLNQKDKSEFEHEGIPPSVTINVTSAEAAKQLKEFMDESE
jgi:hypothetical protein